MTYPYPMSGYLYEPSGVGKDAAGKAAREEAVARLVACSVEAGNDGAEVAGTTQVGGMPAFPGRLDSHPRFREACPGRQ